MLRKSVRLQDIRRLLKNAQALELSPHAVKRLKWYLYACDHDRNISLTCRHFGIARSTFLRWSDRFDPHDPSTLEEHSRRPHHVRAPETDAGVVEQIRQLRMEFPRMGKVGITKLLQERFGVSASASTVGRIIARHHLFFGETDSHKEKRHSAETQEEVTLDIAPKHPSIKVKREGEDGASTVLIPHPSA
jgi:hypothetical protein